MTRDGKSLVNSYIYRLVQAVSLEDYQAVVEYAKTLQSEIEQLHNLVSLYESLVDDDESSEWEHGDVRHQKRLAKRLAKIERLQAEVSWLYCHCKLWDENYTDELSRRKEASDERC
jgi:hypothetical protein